MGAISLYEDGGFPKRGQLFIANENGPELVGQLGGHTAVANENQIIKGVVAAISDYEMEPIDFSETMDYRISTEDWREESPDFSFDYQTDEDSRRNTEEIISTIFAVGQQIIRAIEDKDSNVYMDGRMVSQNVTNVQDSRSRMLGKAPAYM